MVNNRIASELARIVTFNFVDMDDRLLRRDRHFPRNFLHYRRFDAGIGSEV
jgi:hypothetical protein